MLFTSICAAPLRILFACFSISLVPQITEAVYSQLHNSQVEVRRELELPSLATLHKRAISSENVHVRGFIL
jgi:hypothetical protein